MSPFFQKKHFQQLIRRGYPILSAGTVQVFAVAVFMLAARWLAPAELGSWGLFLTLVSLVEMARLGLVQSAVVHFSSHCPADELPVLRRAALLAGIGASLAGSVVLAILGSILNQIWQLPGLAGLLWAFPAVALVTAPLRWHDVVRTGEQDFRGIFRASAYFGLGYLGFLFLVKFLFSEKMTLSALLFLQIPAAVLTIFLRRKTILADLDFGNFRFSKKGKLLEWLRKIWQFGRFGLGSNLFSMLFQRADVLLLAAFVAPAALANYQVAGRLMAWLDFPLNALSLSFLPKIAGENHQNGMAGVATLYQKSVKMLLVIGLPLSFVVFLGAEILVNWVAGDAFSTAGGLLRILLVANLAKPFGRMLGVVLDATGRPADNFKMVVLSLGVNLGLLLVLLPIFGATGAAVAATAGVFLTTAAGWFFFGKIFPSPRHGLFKTRFAFW